MKRTYPIILFILILVLNAVLSACQATPSTPQIVNKSNEIDYASLETSENQLANIPKRYEGNYDTRYPNLNIQFQADIEVDKEANCSVDRIGRMELTDAQIEMLVKSFAKGREVYFEPTEKISGQLEREILYYKEILLNTDDEATKDEIASVIREIEDELADASDGIALKKYVATDAPMNSEFRCICFPTSVSDPFATSMMFITRGGDSFYYYFRNDMVLQTASMVFAGNAVTGEAAGTTIPDPDLSAEDAVLLGNQFLQANGIHDLVCTTVEKARVILNYDNTMKYGWNLVYLRECGGLQTVDIGRAYSFRQDQLPEHAAPWDFQRMEFFITDDGIDGFVWSGASKTIERVAQNVSILPFDDAIMHIGRNIKYKNAWPGKDETSRKADIVVDRLVLGTCAIEVKNHPDQGYVIPTWYAHYFDRELGSDHEAWIAVSAVDGSYIEPMMSAADLVGFQN